MLNDVLNDVLSSALYVHMFGTAYSTKVQCSTCTACFLLFPWQPYCLDTSWCCPYEFSGQHVLPMKRVWISSIFFLMKVDDTQTLMIFLRKRWIGPRGRQRKKEVGSTFVLHTVTTMGRYIMSGSWKKHGMQERAEQRWWPLRRPRAPSSMVHACFPSPAAAPLPRYVTWAIFWTMSSLEISVSKLMLLTLCYQHARCLWLCSVVLGGGQSLL